MKKYTLPVDYTKLEWFERRYVREQYVAEQGGDCYYCGCDLAFEPPKAVTDKEISWWLFPQNFFKYPVHLQHNHKSGMTEGAVHAYCNAVMWEYDGK